MPKLEQDLHVIATVASSRTLEEQRLRTVIEILALSQKQFASDAERQQAIRDIEIRVRAGGALDLDTYAALTKIFDFSPPDLNKLYLDTLDKFFQSSTVLVGAAAVTAPELV